MLKIYTRTGDKGTTSLLGGSRVSKTHQRIEAYGTIDELLAVTGIVRSQITDKTLYQDFIEIQNILMICCSLLADGHNHLKIRKIDSQAIKYLEQRIDCIADELPALNGFIIPGNQTLESYVHLCRTVCRRAERNTLRIKPGNRSISSVSVYLNRLSDYFFVLSRKILKDFNIKENNWKTNL